MSAESSFRENCGPHVVLLSTELFDRNRRRDFTFEAYGKKRSIGIKLNDGLMEDVLSARAGKEAAEWAIGVRFSR